MIAKKLEKAREAFKKNDKDHSKHVHDHHGVESHQQTGAFLRSAVYGGLDGIITTFAIVSGVAGARLDVAIVLILGFSNLIADGISMGVGDYLSSKSEKEYHKSERAREEWEVENYFQGEKNEMIDIYVKKGYSQEDATKIINLLSKNKKAFVDSMMVDELGIMESDENPIKNGAVTFGSFVVFGFVPLFAFVGAWLFNWFGNSVFFLSIILTGVTMFTLGALKVRITGRNWFTSGIEMLLVGSLAAGASYGVGLLLGGLA